MSQEFTFAQALNEAKQVIVQQASRIKSDADKIKVHQDMLTTQGAALSEQDGRIREQAGEIERMASVIKDLQHKLAEAIVAKEQADNIINRQGEKITSMQAVGVEMATKISELSEKIHMLDRERESLVERLPTQEDSEALAAMSALLMRKATHGSQPPKPAPQMRLAEAA